MSLILNCTLTGASEETDPAMLADVSARFPLAEWGVLWSPKRAGDDNRYPRLPWILRVTEQARRHGMRCALHLCGSGVDQFLEGHPIMGSLLPGFGRIQVNFNQRHKPKDLARLAERIAASPVPVITQYNKGNAAVPAAIPHPNHQLLFDSSGGRGVEAQEWLAPVGGHLCGYAGGLGPQNLDAELPRIAAASASRPFWIDMEGKLRDDMDFFSLDRAVEVLERVEAFRQQLDAALREEFVG